MPEGRPSGADEKASVASAEDYSRVPVPISERKGWLDLTALNAGFNIGLFSVVFGGIVATAFNIVDSMAVTAIGTAILMCFSCLFAYVGAETGMGLVLLSERTFGAWGNKVPGFLWGFAFLVWNGTIGLAMASVAPVPWALGAQAGYSAGVLALLSFGYLAFWGIASVYGVRIMKWVARVGVPALVVVMAVGTIQGIRTAGGWRGLVACQPVAPGSISYLYGIALAISAWAIGASTVPDISRFARSGKQSIPVALIGMGVAGFAQYFMGAVMVLAVGASDLGMAFQRLFGSHAWVAPIVWLFVFLGAWTSTQMEVYAGSLAWSNVFGTSRVKTAWIFLLISSAIGGIMLYFGLNETIVAWMSVLGMVYPGFLGAILADHFILRRWQRAIDSGLALIRWKSLAAWVLASGISVTLYLTEQVDVAFIYYTPIVGALVHTALHIPEILGRQRSAEQV